MPRKIICSTGQIVKASLSIVFAFSAYVYSVCSYSADELSDQRLFFTPEQRRQLVQSHSQNHSLERSEPVRAVMHDTRHEMEVFSKLKVSGSQDPSVVFNGYVLYEGKLVLWIDNMPWTIHRSDKAASSDNSFSVTRDIWFKKELAGVQLPPGRKITDKFKSEVRKMGWRPMERRLIVVLSDESIHELDPGAAVEYKNVRERTNVTSIRSKTENRRQNSLSSGNYFVGAQ